jgi:quinol monooxygenase YgiN
MKDTAVRVQAATLKEAGSILYGYFQDVETTDAFLLFEWWQNFEAMAAHVELPHFQELMRTFRAVGGEGRTVGIYKPLPF